MTDLPPAHHYIGYQHISFVSAPGAIPCYTATQMREYRNQALEEAIAKVHIAMLGADRQLTVRVLTALNALKGEVK